MFLSKLEIFGFKSFYQKVLINFNSGMTGIVGPNGCGKSNVVDAMRWVLGEQRPSALRSERMESVIFNGTRKIKPLGLAEVSLTVENTTGQLKTEYSEIMITRRLYRSGESEYLLNKTVCRLRDIIDLFMDSGMGFNAYSVIELKMIELILNDKTNERRRMFEEAAGVTKYKQRRQSALRKLDSVQQDLTRVQDIISEVEKVVRSLERQAKKAEHYTNLQEELKSLEIELIEREYLDIKNSIEPMKRKLEDLRFLKMRIDTKITNDEAGYESIRKDLLEKEEKLQEARLNLSENSNEIRKLEHHVVLQKERLKSMSESIVRYEKENENLVTEIDELDRLKERDKVLIEKINEEIESINFNYDEKNIELSSLNTDYDNKNIEIKENTEKKYNIINYISSIKNKHSNINNQVESILERDENIDGEIETAREEIYECSERILKYETESEELKSKVIDSEREFQNKEDEKKKIQEELEILQKKSFDIQSQIGKNISKIDFLKGLIEKNIGISEGVQFLSRKNDWIDRPVLTVSEAVFADSKYRIAIEAALGEYSNFIIVNNASEANSGIDILKKANHGKATFICLDRINKLLISENSSESYGGTAAIEIIKCNDEFKQLFKFLLRDVFVYNSIDEAIKSTEKNVKIFAITLEGEIVTGQGFIRGGSKRIDEGMQIGKKDQIKELADIVDSLKIELDENQRIYEEKNAYFNSIDIREFANKIVSAKNNLSELEKKIFEIQVKKNQLNNNIEKISHEKNKLNSEKEKLASSLGETIPEIENKEIELREIEEYLKTINSIFTSLESERTHKNKELNEINIMLVSKKSEVQNYSNEIDRSEQNIDNIKKIIERHNAEIIQFKNDILTIDNDILEKEKSLTELLEKNVVLEKNRDIVQNEYSKKREEVEVIERVLKDERKNHDESLNEISEMELRYSELKMRAENLNIKAKDEYQFELQTKLFEDSDTFNFNEAKEKVKLIKDKINSVGPVNLLAFSEYQEEKQRLDFLVTQKSDLHDAEKNLMQTIDEINHTAKEKFDETFQQIRTNFINVFKTLFDEGDEADLRFLEDVDPLEGEIEIIAKPRGKRPLSIDSLSGGEKTLTAISLLFAIYLVKPSPFCILDEVDAPLDDANVDRFVKILRKFSDKTQFIVVTHNKRTMEAADTLYGVTMEEEGVSKVVAVKFDESFNFNKN